MRQGYDTYIPNLKTTVMIDRSGPYCAVVHVMLRLFPRVLTTLASEQKYLVITAVTPDARSIDQGEISGRHQQVQ